MVLTPDEQAQANRLAEAMSALVDRVIGVEPCGCGAPSIALSVDTEAPIADDGKTIVIHAYWPLCSRCAAHSTTGGSA